jgi:hypothetical protein
MMNQPIDESTRAQVSEALKNATVIMKSEGFGIANPVQVVVDPQLPFMGYTMPQKDGFRVVVSGVAVRSGMLLGLLVHELSHIYRIQTNHPSHDGRLIQGAMSSLETSVLSPDYKLRIVQDLVNDIQDLYADDIAVKVMKRGRILSNDQLSTFLQDWVKDEPVQSGNAERDRWVNLSILAKNARAISQMRRHGIRDIGDKAANLNKRFLSRLPVETSRHYEYFQNILTNLNENITEEAYRSLLAAYLNKFEKIAETTEM